MHWNLGQRSPSRTFTAEQDLVSQCVLEEEEEGMSLARVPAFRKQGQERHDRPRLCVTGIKCRRMTSLKR
jgi:hypothetical protein